MEYRGRNLMLDEDKLRIYGELAGHEFDISNIDQYLLNETDKTGLEPFNIDFDKIAARYSIERIEKITDHYLDFEIRLRDDRVQS